MQPVYISFIFCLIYRKSPTPLHNLTKVRQVGFNESVPSTYSIAAAAKATGLSAHTIRAWEKRYDVIKPDRTGTNRRQYDQTDIERLTLLKKATELGHSISMIAQTPNDELLEIVKHTPSATSSDSSFDPLEHCIAAMNNLDSEALESELSRSLLMIGADRFISEIALPLVAHLDAGWENQTVSIAQEHLVSALLRAQLDQIRTSIRVAPNAPRMLVTTPAGQLHEIGALIAAISGARLGWRVTYLGPNLPASEIATAAKDSNSTVIGLSLVYPLADQHVNIELKKLRSLLPNATLLIGGRAAESYKDVMSEIRAIHIVSPQDLESILRSSAKRTH